MKILVFKVGREILSIMKKALYIVCPHTVGPIRTKQFLICHLKLILDLIRKARVSRESLESWNKKRLLSTWIMLLDNKDFRVNKL